MYHVLSFKFRRHLCKGSMGFLNIRAQNDKIYQQFFLFKNLNIYKINNSHHGKCFVRFYSLVEEYQKTH